MRSSRRNGTAYRHLSVRQVFGQQLCTTTLRRRDASFLSRVLYGSSTSGMSLIPSRVGRLTVELRQESEPNIRPVKTLLGSTCFLKGR